MSAIVELSNKPCHFCGKDGTNFKTKVKAQELQAVLCEAHLKEVLKGGQDANQKSAKSSIVQKPPASA